VRIVNPPQGMRYLVGFNLTYSGEKPDKEVVYENLLQFSSHFNNLQLGKRE